MAQPDLKDLCILLVEDAYGSLCSKIFSAVVARGSLDHLQILAHLPKDSPRDDVYQALCTLIQNRVLQYGNRFGGYAKYRPNWSAAQALSHHDRLIRLVTTRYGGAAAKIFIEVTRKGHTTIEDLAQTFGMIPRPQQDLAAEPSGTHVNGSTEKSGNGNHQNQTNGENGEDEDDEDDYRPKASRPNHWNKTLAEEGIYTRGDFYALVGQMLRSGILAKVCPRSFVSEAELNAEAEHITIEENYKDGKVSGPTKRKKFLADIQDLRRRWQEEDSWFKRDESGYSQVLWELKRRAKRSILEDGVPQGAQRPAKRTKLDAVANGVCQHDESAEEPAEQTSADKPAITTPNKPEVTAPPTPPDTEASATELAADGPTSTQATKSPSASLKRKAAVEVEVLQDMELLTRTQRSVKRSKAEAGENSTSGTSNHRVSPLPHDMYVGIGFNQGVVALRSERLQEMCAQYLGPVTGSVYGALLQRLELELREKPGELDDRDKSKADAEEDSDDDGGEAGDLLNVRTDDILEFLDPDMNLSETLCLAVGQDSTKNGDKKNKRKTKMGFADDMHRDLGIKTEVLSDDEPDQSEIAFGVGAKERRRRFLQEHLTIMQESEREFVLAGDRDDRSGWRVDLASLAPHLANDEVDKTVLGFYGKEAVRLVALVREVGKLEHKPLITRGLFKTTEAGDMIAELHHDSICDVQEIRKDATCKPENTYYTVYHDARRVGGILERVNYEAAARALRRLQVESEKVDAIRHKMEMKGLSAEQLPRKEAKRWKRWCSHRLKLLTLIGRMEDSAANLAGWNIVPEK